MKDDTHVTEKSRINVPLIAACAGLFTLAGAIGGGGVVWGTTSARLTQLEHQVLGLQGQVTGMQKSLDTANQLLARIDERTSKAK